MKRVIVALIVVSLALVGCVGEPTKTVPVSPPIPAPSIKNVPIPTVLSNEPPVDVTWISPGKVNVSNFYPGARAEYDLAVHNGNDKATKFKITYRVPSHTGAGYEKAPVEAQDWVIIADETPVLMPKETREIMIALDMPLETTAPPKWEFWVSIIQASQGNIQTELCSRWLIDMRGSS